LTRILRVVFHNWPLKLAAVGLATLMYGGLVVSQDAETFTGVIPVTPISQPADTVIMSSAGQVTLVRYFSSDGSRPATSTFIATIDLSSIEARSGSVRIEVNVESQDPRIRVLDWEPRFVTITLDPLVSKTVPVQIERGTVPDGLEIGESTRDPSVVTVTGPDSVIRQVVAARADVVIQPTGIDVDQDVQLIAIDALGDARSPVRVEPATARITIRVFSDRQTRSLPVNPVVVGTPAAGFEIASVTADAQVVLVEGDADQLAALDRADTLAISVSGLSSDLTTSIGFDLPEGVVPLTDATIRVTVTLRPITGTRTFGVGLSLPDARPDLIYAISTNQVLLTVGGAAATLDALSGATLVARLDVAGLGPGTHDVTVTATLPAGVAFVSAAPSSVQVTITAPPPQPEPSEPGPVEPSPSPS
jgi:YbbR domain-containing protein